MSTLSDQIAAQHAAAKAKPKKKTAKRDDHGRFIKKDDPDLETPSL